MDFERLRLLKLIMPGRIDGRAIRTGWKYDLKPTVMELMTVTALDRTDIYIAIESYH